MQKTTIHFPNGISKYYEDNRPAIYSCLGSNLQGHKVFMNCRPYYTNKIANNVNDLC